MVIYTAIKSEELCVKKSVILSTATKRPLRDRRGSRKLTQINKWPLDRLSFSVFFFCRTAVLSADHQHHNFTGKTASFLTNSWLWLEKFAEQPGPVIHCCLLFLAEEPVLQVYFLQTLDGWLLLLRLPWNMIYLFYLSRGILRSPPQSLHQVPLCWMVDEAPIRSSSSKCVSPTIFEQIVV